MGQPATLVIGALRTNGELFGVRQDLAMLERRIDRVAREQLPAALAQWIAKSLPGDHEVYRIRRIEIDLLVSRSSLETGELARSWAHRIKEALTHQILHGGSENVVRFEDHGQYVAGFVADVLRGRAVRDWVFAEFAPLKHLNVSDALTEVLVARPRHLQFVACFLADRDLLSVLTSRLDERQGRKILEALRSDSPGRPPGPVELLRAIERLIRLAGPSTLSGRRRPARSLELVMRLLAAEGVPPTGLPAVVAAARRLVGLQRIHATLSPGQLARMLDAGRPFGGSFDTLPAESRIRLHELAVDLGEHGGAHVRRLLQALNDVAGETYGRKPEPQRDTLQFWSPFAGLCLVLPVLRELRLHRILSQPALHAVLCYMAPSHLRPLLRADPLLGVLFPRSGRPASLPGHELRTAWETVDERKLFAGLSANRRERIRREHGRRRWALTIAARFCQRLPGLADSSLDYLGDQFLCRAGRIEVTAESLIVSLSDVPLGVVLRMAGLHGDQTRLPWLDERLLSIRFGAG